MKLLLPLILIIFARHASSQSYSFRDYLNDQKTSRKIYKAIQVNNIDSVKEYLSKYKNRLGFTYYQCKTLIANKESNPNQYTFLDSAFMRGMTPLCIDKHLSKFDSVKVQDSFRQNYLRAFNRRLISVIDSMQNKDQYYRQQMDMVMHSEEPLSANIPNGVENKSKITLKQPSKKQQMDSLWKLQNPIDSANILKVKEIIKQYGWPGAKLVGDNYCQRPGPDVTILFTHLGNTQREFQISTLQKVIELCKKQEDSWQNAEGLLFGLHSKFSGQFSEFSFLEIKNNKINKEESFFSVYKMSELIIKAVSKRKIEIRCAKLSLYNELKEFMLSMNELITIDEQELKFRKDEGMRTPGKLDESCFSFIESPETSDNTISYRLIRE
ncbi:MAG: hypothetical protein H0W61_17755 [Bacteroidetes bacterium]|nr:hypothetical protein [Bacteroidota bacterium]